MTFPRTAAALVGLLLAPSLASAWNAEGHRQIADLAWIRLTPKTRAAVIGILKNADPKFAADGSDEANAREAFRQLSTMPDVIKGDKRTAYEPFIDGFNRTWLPTPDPKDREQERTKTWHYYDVPIRFRGPKPKVSESNARNAIQKAQEELKAMGAKGDASLLASWWLGWIEHLAGDLHQPLHCVSSYEHDHEEGDAGGNGIKLDIKGRNGRALTLHAYWDEGIDRAKAAEGGTRGATSIEATTARWSADKAYVPAVARVKDVDALSWIQDGARLADRYVYGAEMKSGYVPTATYEVRLRALCKRQAILGGYRLAHLLNGIFDPSR